MSAPTGTIHIEHPDDNMYCLCGRMQNRNDPVSDGADVDCLKCLVLEEEDRKAILE